MLKLYLYLLLLVPALNRPGTVDPAAAGEAQQNLYTTLHLAEKGLSDAVFRLAMKGHEKLEHDGKLKNSEILTIVDFSQSSRNKRMYVIDIFHKALLFNTYVAHGRNTGDEFAKYFSNVAGSLKSSLGFYVTREEAVGSSVGLSLILEGLERGINDNARSREIIMHGAAYATESFIRRTGRLGRSFGCPALPPEVLKPVLETIKEGSCLFIYQKDEAYLKNSPVLR